MYQPCVRCGQRARGDDLYVCQPCAVDPVKLDEVRQANAATADISDPNERRRIARNYLVKTFHWAGKWSRR